MLFVSGASDPVIALWESGDAPATLCQPCGLKKSQSCPGPIPGWSFPGLVLLLFNARRRSGPAGRLKLVSGLWCAVFCGCDRDGCEGVWLGSLTGDAPDGAAAREGTYQRADRGREGLHGAKVDDVEGSAVGRETDINRTAEASGDHVFETLRS